MAKREIPLQNYLLEHHPGDDVLWITFDHAGLPKHRAEDRLGWGVKELTRNGWSVLSVKAHRADWFLKPDLQAFFTGPGFAQIASGKRRIVLYGLSMGGFGALACSTLIPGSVVLAISPQTTLDPVKVPWEKRFDYALGEDWTGPLGDIDQLNPAHAEAYVIYCPANKFDGPHVDRLRTFGPLTLLPLIGNAHTPGGLLMEGGLLKEIVQAVGAGPIDPGILDAKHETLECSAAYHYFLGSEAGSADEREAALDRCLDLASPAKHEYYRQRVAGLRMRLAARAADTRNTIRHYKELRRCASWRRSCALKVMAARYLLRAEALEPVRDLITEIRRRHPEGHPKLGDLVRQADALAIRLDGLADAQAARQAERMVGNG